MTADDLIQLLVERGPEGVTVGEIAAMDPRVHHHVYNMDIVDDFDDPVDLGPRGVDEDIRHGAALRLLRLHLRGAVLDHPDRSSPSLCRPDDRFVLRGWSGLGVGGRSIPTADELELTDPTAIVEAFLRAIGGGGGAVTQIAFWATRIDDPTRDPYQGKVWAKAIAELRGAGWEIHQLAGVLEGELYVQPAAAPDAPMREPADGPLRAEVVGAAWPAHHYRYDSALFDLLIDIERNHRREIRSVGTWFGGTGQNPNPSYGGPRFVGEHPGDGETKRRQLLDVAERCLPPGLAAQVRDAAVPGSIELWLDDEPVGAVEIAERLGVKRTTVDMWTQRGRLPEPDMTVSGRSAWRWQTIWTWAQATGRL